MPHLLTDVIDEYGVYSDQRLKEYIYGLEQRFNVHDEVDLFSQLVNFSKNKDIPYHGWFKYREGFSHTLIKELLERSGIGQDEYVLDPFCGSGTTVVEAALNGYSGIGIDINPMSAFISEVKCRSYTDEEITAILELTKTLFELLKQQVPNDEYLKKYQQVEKFFSSKNYKRLIAIKEVIDNKKNIIGNKIYELLLCVYICIIEDVSDRKRDGNGLRIRVSKVADVEQFYVEKLQEMIRDIQKYRIRGEQLSILNCGNAMKLTDIVERCSGSIDKSLGTIIYSPPYTNSFDYFESYKIEMILADYVEDMKEIRKYRQQAVESFIGRTDKRNKSRDFVDWMSQEIENAIPEKEARSGRRDSRTRKVPKMIKGYFTDMEKVISESSNVLATGKKCYIVVDQSAYLGRIVPTDLFLAAIAEHYNFRATDIIICRVAKTSGQQIQLYPYLSESLRESIVVLEKI